MSSKVAKTDDLNYDLGNILATDSHPINEEALKADPLYLQKRSRDNVQLLVNKLFSLPTMKSAEGLLVILPEGSTPIPREKPIPKAARDLTRFERIAREKNIRLRKRDKMVYDKDTDEFRARFGYKRANDIKNQWLIEGHTNLAKGEDPFLLAKQRKRKQASANLEARDRNRHKIAKRNDHIAGDIPLNIEFQAALNNKKDIRSNNFRNKDRDVVNHVYEQVARSTASMGQFDKKFREERAAAKHKRQSAASMRVSHERHSNPSQFSTSEHDVQRSIVNRINRVREKQRTEKLKDNSTNIFQTLMERQQQKNKKRHLLTMAKEKYKKKNKNRK
mmetsp:Transcript_10761/g.15745  ORF Transcript_10761/g.15745 Transcript_10761/m.15745 type:complete len:333 (-) Transcript_10761:2-1000(-)